MSFDKGISHAAVYAPCAIYLNGQVGVIQELRTVHETYRQTRTRYIRRQSTAKESNTMGYLFANGEERLLRLNHLSLYDKKSGRR